MARIVSTQTGARRSRIRVINRHVTVRHELSDAFRQRLKTRRIPRVLADLEPLDLVLDRTLLSGQSRGISDPLERPVAHVNRQETTQLPRLGAYLDQVTGHIQSDQPVPVETELPRTQVSRVPGRKSRIPKSTSRSAYEELCAKWGRI